MNLRKTWFTFVQVAYDLVLKMNPRKLAAHAVIQDDQGQVLMLRSRYADQWWLPGGGLNRREHLDTAVVRECQEELGLQVEVEALTGLYYQVKNSTYIGIFACRIVQGEVQLSHEHSEMGWVPLVEVPERWRPMVQDALSFTGKTRVHTIN